VRDWSELWLSEGFATYLTLLSEGHDKGEDEFSYQLKQTQDNVAGSDVGDRRRPTVTKRYFSPEDLFDNRIYGKGGCILNMLRRTVGDSLFLKGLRQYVSRYAFKSVETNQFRLAMEDASGLNLDWFFDEWVYGAGYPKFEISTRWDQGLRAVAVRVAQTQERDSLTGIFRTPVDIQVWVNGNPETYSVMITDSVNEFSFPAYQEPQLVIFDRGSNLLKSAVFRKGADQWIYQLAHAADAADRVDAVSELRWTVDTPAVKAALAASMIDDRFWGVRYEAALALADSKESLPPELLAAYGDRDARVRGAVVRALGNFGGEEAVRTLRHAFESDSSYTVIANALGALVKCDSAGSLQLCLDGLTREGVDDAVRNASLRGLSTYTRVEGTLDSLLAYTVKGRPRNLRVLAVSLLARHRDDDDVMDHLVGMLDDPSFHVRRAVIEGLGRSGYEDALTPLRRRLVEETDARLRQAIREAIQRIEKTNND
jgi:aminopeptidase N